jgi:O-antigen/teichoic acid export membrane protein
MLFFLFLFLQKKDLIFVLMKSEVRREEFRFKYTLTYFVASQFYNLGLRMDLFLLSYFRYKIGVADYGLAQKIILTIITTIVSITQVLSPLYSSVSTKKELRPHIKTSLLYMMVPGLLFFFMMLTPDIVYFYIFTDTYTQTPDIARAMGIPFIISAFGSIPMLFLLYTVKKPRYILITNILFFLIITIGCYYIIPMKGVFGPPYVLLIAMAVAVGIQTLAGIYEYERLPEG